MTGEPEDLPGVTFVPVTEAMAEQLGAFLDDLRTAGDEATFHPHPLTRDEARQIAHRAGLDVYLVGVERDRVVTYGMLRGWDEGFAVPSLGVAVHPAHRGRGLGRRMMGELHTIARARGATRVRLTLDVDHSAAKTLYASLGYRFEGSADGRLVGWLSLEGTQAGT